MYMHVLHAHSCLLKLVVLSFNDQKFAKLQCVLYCQCDVKQNQRCLTSMTFRSMQHCYKITFGCKYVTVKLKSCWTNPAVYKRQKHFFRICKKISRTCIRIYLNLKSTNCYFLRYNVFVFNITPSSKNEHDRAAKLHCVRTHFTVHNSFERNLFIWTNNTTCSS